MKSKLFLLFIALGACVQFLGNQRAVSINAGEDQIWPTVDHNVIWTKWDASHYALADDGDSIWLGTASGLIRWSKLSSSFTRYSTADGLPHRDVLAVAVDGLGNRWFGGDGGLSRLGADEEWVVYDIANSGIHSNSVDGIAVAANATVWLSHLPDPNISQLSFDGTWVIYADRKTAVTSNYATIKQTVNSNSLWTVSGDDVWVGYERYDGTSWQTLAPPQVSESPQVVDADSKGKVWFLSDNHTVYSWDGAEWLEYSFWGYFDGFMNTLAVGENDEVWIGWEERDGIPYTNHVAGISRVSDTPGTIDLDEFLSVPPPVAALWPTEEGVWGTGPNWLLLPGGAMVRFNDEPILEDVNEVVVDKLGRTWVHSSYTWPYTAGIIQTLDDKGTGTMADDEGEVWDAYPSIIRALEPAPNGDLWVAWETNWRVRYPGPPLRFHGDTSIVYTPPSSDAFIGDIFVQNSEHTWFTYTRGTEKGIWSLDDGGTPAITSDDIWQSYPLETQGSGGGLVAVQADRIWYGDSSGLYLHQDASWEQVDTGWVTDLVPASSGSLFVGTGDSVLLVQRDGQQSKHSIADLVSEELALVRTTKRRNLMWTVAPDGGVWFWASSKQLARQDDAGIQLYPTPVTADFMRHYLEVDQNNHVWLADGSLWRMSSEPGFSLEIRPQLWLMTADDSQMGTIIVAEIAGFDEMVTLAINDLPAGVSATIGPNPVSPGETATLRLTTDEANLGDYELVVNGDSTFLAHERALRLVVVEQVYRVAVPLVTR